MVSLIHCLVLAVVCFFDLGEASRLLVASYAGSITTIDVCNQRSNGYTLKKIAESRACAIPGPQLDFPPSWINLDASGETMYCANPGEGLPSRVGTLFSLEVHHDGSLLPLANITIPTSAAHAAIYAGGSSLAIAFLYVPLFLMPGD